MNFFQTNVYGDILAGQTSKHDSTHNIPCRSLCRHNNKTNDFPATYLLEFPTMPQDIQDRLSNFIQFET
jgi:hypothetical protein